MVDWHTTPIVHPDHFNTGYLEIRFPAGCVDGLGGTPVVDADSSSGEKRGPVFGGSHPVRPPLEAMPYEAT